MECVVCKFFLRVFSFIEVVMQCIKKHFLSALVLSVLGFSTAVSALENIDCIDYSGEPDGRCQYYRIMDNRGARLWVVPPGEDTCFMSSSTVIPEPVSISAEPLSVAANSLSAASRLSIWASPTAACWIRTFVELDTA